MNDLDLASFEGVWPAVVARVRDDAGPRRHAWLREATPVAVDGGAVTLEVPAHLPFHFEQLKADLELHAMVKAIGASLLGGGIEVSFRISDEDGRAEPGDPARAPDKDDLAEAADGDDPASLVVEALGGEIVSE